MLDASGRSISISDRDEVLVTDELFTCGHFRIIVGQVNHRAAIIQVSCKQYIIIHCSRQETVLVLQHRFIEA